MCTFWIASVKSPLWFGMSEIRNNYLCDHLTVTYQNVGGWLYTPHCTMNNKTKFNYLLVTAVTCFLEMCTCESTLPCLVRVREAWVERCGFDVGGRFDHLWHFAATKQPSH